MGMGPDDGMAPAVARIAGFWRRVFAFLVDGLLLAITGSAAGWLAFDAMASLGLYGRLVGFLVALAYFGVLNSRIGGGQTLGKRAFGVRVVDSAGQLLPMPRSLLRYCVLGIPFALNGVPFGPAAMQVPWASLLSAIAVGGMLSIAYLYVFNRRTRQSLHDLAVGSWVVCAGPAGAPVPAIAAWHGHLVVVALLVLGVAAVPPVLDAQFEGGTLDDLVLVHRVVVRVPGVQAAELEAAFDPRTWEPTGKVEARVRMAAGTVDEARARGLAGAIFGTRTTSLEIEHLSIVLRRGYDLGFASAWKNHQFDFEAVEFAPAPPATGDPED